MKPKINTKVCVLCEECIFECPYDAIYIDLKRGRIKINYKKCRGCGKCIDVCPVNAIK